MSPQPRPAPRTMILFDPDLGTDLDPSATADALRSARAKSSLARLRSTQPAARLPSARSLTRFLHRAQAAVRLRGQVTVLLTTDAAIRRLNRQFRGKNKATDVLSFPADGGRSGKERIAGDLAISVPTAQRQGTARSHSLAAELKVLMLHGLLHLAGYDHETDSGQMARREHALRGKLGLPTGLIERAVADEGDGFQPVRKRMKKPVVLAAEGKSGAADAVPSEAKAPRVRNGGMHGLKPVPSILERPPKIVSVHPGRKNMARMGYPYPAAGGGSSARRRKP